MKTLGRFILTIAMLHGAGALFGGQAYITAELSPVRPSYIVGEPIELLLCIRNAGPDAASVVAPYPFARGIELRFASEQAPRSRRPADPVIVEDGPRAPVIRIEPGESWEVSVFVQRYMPDPPPGNHKLFYSIEIAALNNDLVGRTPTGQGTLEISIAEARPEQMRGAIAQLAQRLGGTGIDYWRMRGAEEGLALATSPEVLPYLERIFKSGMTSNDLRPLAKFRGNHEAEDLLLRTIRAGTVSQLLTGLSVLQEWRYRLSPADFQVVIDRGTPETQALALRYAANFGDPGYTPIVERLVHSDSSWVATEAKQVLLALTSPGRQ